MTTATLPPIARPDWLLPSQWPFETFAVECGGSRIAVTEAGRGPVLLFVHVGMWSFVWRDLVARLAPDFRCVFFDAPGTGLTRDRPGAAVSLDAASRAVSAIIDTLDLRDLTLVAHDLGGPAGIAAVAAAPHRVRGLVAMNALGWRPSGTALRFMLSLVGSRVMREINALTGFLPRITASSFGVGRRLDQAGRDVFLAGVDARGRRSFHNYMRDACHNDLLYGNVARALAGPLAGLPLLTIFGERNDPFGFQQRWKKLFPDARQEVVAGGNHFPMCDAPDFVARVIREWHRDCVA